MMASCVETGDEPTPNTPDTPATGKYTVAITDGGAGAIGAGTYSAGDTVWISIGTAPAGKEFYMWNSNPPVVFDDELDEDTWFIMPAASVNVRANWKTIDIPVQPTPSVRFSWDRAYISLDSSVHISYIWASVNDVDYWKTNVFDEMYEDDSYEATDIPLKPGAPGVPNALYSMDSAATILNYGKYFSTTEGDYTAVCTLEDEDEAITDIVANYHTQIDGDLKFFEIAFDVKGLLEGTRTNGWTDDSYNTNDTDPMLKTKAGKGKLLKKVTKGNVTYYVLRRPKK